MQLFYIKFCTIIFMISLLTGCKQKQRKPITKKGNHSIKTVTLTPFELVVDGVECELCAHCASTRLQSIEGIKNPHFEGSYECGIITYQWNKNATPPLAKIIEALKAEGFAFISLQGLLFGQFMEDKENNHVFVLGDGLSINVSNTFKQTRMIDDNAWRSVEKNTPCTIHGIIWLDATSKRYWLVKQ